MELGIKEIYSQHWVAGVRGGGSGVNVHVTFEEGSLEGVELDKCYFTCEGKGKSARLQDKRRDGLWVAYFHGEANGYDEMMEERWMGRRGGPIGDELVPGERRREQKPVEEIPYELGKGQAVITYKCNGEEKELRIDSVETKPMIPYC